MKEVDFGGCVNNRFLDDKGDDDDSEMEPPRLDQPASHSEHKSGDGKKDDKSYQSEVSIISFRRSNGGRSGEDSRPGQSSDAVNESTVLVFFFFFVFVC